MQSLRLKIHSHQSQFIKQYDLTEVEDKQEAVQSIEF